MLISEFMYVIRKLKHWIKIDIIKFSWSMPYASFRTYQNIAVVFGVQPIYTIFINNNWDLHLNRTVL